MGIPILRIRGEDGLMHDVLAIRGPVGPKGESGDNGVYYTSLSSAITDINNGTTANALTDKSGAKVRASKAEDGRTLVTLLDDLSESVQIDINKDIDLVLNGKTLSLTAEAAYLNFGADIDCSINGEADGSEIVKVCPNATSNTAYVVKTAAHEMCITGGKYEISGKARNQRVFHITGNSATITDAEIITISESTLTNAVSRGIVSDAVGLHVEILRSTLSVRAAMGECTTIYSGATLGVCIEDSSLSAVLTGDDGYATCVRAWDGDYPITISRTRLFGDALGCGEDDLSTATALKATTTTILNDVEAIGTHSAISAGKNAKLYVNGGTYTGFCHGGFYFAHGQNGEAFVNDAAIRCGNYEGEFDYSGKTEFILGGFYIGGGTSENNSNMTVYLDNCTIDGSTGLFDFVLRGSSGETNNTVNISNSHCVKGQIRDDAGFGHRLNVGVGTNITVSMITNNGVDAVFTNQLYRRNAAEKTLNGHDYDALHAWFHSVMPSEDEIARMMVDGIYPGADLTVKFAAEIANYSSPWAWIKARIQAGNFDGIHTKDYIPFVANGTTYHAEIAGINTYKNYGNVQVGNHIDFICRELWATTKRINPVYFNNGTTVSEYPWLACELFLYLNSRAGQVPNSTDNTPVMLDVDYTADGVYYYLPEEMKAVIIEKRFNLEKRYTAGSKLSVSNNYGWTDIGKLWLPTETEVYGTAVWCVNPYSMNGSAGQYPIFRGNMNRVKKRGLIWDNWWLLNPSTTNALTWCNVQTTGGSIVSVTSNAFSFPVCFRIG